MKFTIKQHKSIKATIILVQFLTTSLIHPILNLIYT